MQSRAFGVVLCAIPALLFSCGPQEGGQSGAEVIGPGPETPREPSPQNPVDPSQPGASECSTDADCEEIAANELDQLSEPSPAPTLTAEVCEPVSVILDVGSASGNSCRCEADDGRVFSLGPVGIQCHRLGRLGNCLFDDEDFTGCEVDDPSTCEDDCALLEQRLAEDAARTFETSIVQAECNGDGGCANVVEVDGQCYPNQSYRDGLAYDCSLGVAGILDAYAEDTAPPELIEQPAALANYVAGTDGTLSLTVNSSFNGTFASPVHFSARADFVSVDGGTEATTGEVLDPLEGVDDCGAMRQGNLGTTPDVEWFAADEAVLLDGRDEYPFETYTPGFTFYGLDLTTLGVEPRYGGKYGFRASGGTLMSAFESGELTLPQALSFPALEQSARVERGAIVLQWTGTGSQPLYVRMSFKDKLADSFTPVTVDCLLQDDGGYTIAESVLEDVPDGFVSLYARRRSRTIEESGQDAFVLDGDVTVSHELVFGEQCETPEVLQACLDSVEAQRLTKEACGGYDPDQEPPIEQQCPSYLAESCQGCVSFFECQAENLRCENGGLVSYSGCACP